MADLQKASEINPRDTEALFNLALAHLHLRQEAEALDVLDRLLAIDPRDAEALKLRAQLWKSKSASMSLADWQRELADAQAAHNRAAEAQAHIELGSLAHEQGDLETATRHFEVLLAIGRAIPDARLEYLGLGNLGGIYFLAGRRDEGIAMLEQARAAAHQQGQTLHEANYSRNLGQCYLKTTRPVEAIEAFERAQRLFKQLGSPPDQQLADIIQKLREILKR